MPPASLPTPPARLSRVALASFALAAAALLPTTPRAEAGTLYAFSDVFNQIYIIDTTTGAATLIGTLPPVDTMAGIDFDDDGVLHGVTIDTTGDMELWRLDPGAGTATLVGPTGDSCVEGGLAYAAIADVFYAKWGGVGGGTSTELVAIDPDTGLGTLVGNMGLDPFAEVNGLAVLADGTLLAYDSNAAGPSRLFEVDTTTGLATVIGAGDIGDGLLVSGVGGLAYDADTDTLYMSNAGELWTIDPATGVGTLVGPHGLPSLITGLAVRPDPCMLGLDLTSRLYDIDASSGAGSNVRVLSGSKFGGLAYDEASGVLYGMRAAPIPELYAIDVPTGDLTLIGPLGIPHLEGGLDVDPLSGGLFGVGGQSELFVLDTTSGAALVVGLIVDEFGAPIDPSGVAFDADGDLFVLKASALPPEIYEIDPSDASVLARVPLPGLPFASAGGMAFDDSTGILYLSYGDVLYRADPSTGATIVVGPTPAGSALEVVGGCGLPPPVLAPVTPALGVGAAGVGAGAPAGTPSGSALRRE